MTIDVKICGLTTADMLDVAIDAGAAFGGLVFEPRSLRDISIEQAAQLTAHNAGRIKMVALFVDADDALLDAVCASVKPDFIQMHGDESPERVACVCAATGLPIIKAIGVKTADDARRGQIYEDVADLILFDTKLSDDPQKVLPGGSGQVFDWHLVKNILTRPFMLAGGLNAGNLQKAIDCSGAGSVDVSSAVERGAGQKDGELIKEFIAAAHGAVLNKME